MLSPVNVKCKNVKSRIQAVEEVPRKQFLHFLFHALVPRKLQEPKNFSSPLRGSVEIVTLVYCLPTQIRNSFELRPILTNPDQPPSSRSDSSAAKSVAKPPPPHLHFWKKLQPTQRGRRSPLRPPSSSLSRSSQRPPLRSPPPRPLPRPPPPRPPHLRPPGQLRCTAAE